MVPAAEPVASGQVYTISHVDGYRPESWDDFAGGIHLTLIGNGQHLDITDEVARTADSVRFYQKDLALPDRDIRAWTITASGTECFSRNRSQPFDPEPQPERRLALTAQKAGNA